MNDVGDLERFVRAQDEHGTYDRALAELRRGRKTSHWMWFVFPQLAGLGRSATAQYYAIDGAGEARDYLAHPVLGARLRESCTALLEQRDDDAVRVLGSVDAMKLRSSMTLFAAVAPPDAVFAQVLQRFFGGERDAATEALLRAAD
ncbi:MAG: DUF1810 domain-containing protein [Jatrophihabitans sp.]|uniref:DUF1810 domain-containing protein n=1 Tax=Jatrophihabitans sp. TaxID=1932789 RepID=UPI003F7F6C7F